MIRTSAQRDRDVARVALAHPYLARQVLAVLDGMAAFGYPMFVTDSLRLDAEQRALYAQGRTAPGTIVTKADGVTHKSMHQKQIDGFGHAIDCAFLDDPTTAKLESWDPEQPWAVYGTMGEAVGLTWGGRWVSMLDRPHLELALGSPFSS